MYIKKGVIVALILLMMITCFSNLRMIKIKCDSLYLIVQKSQYGYMSDVVEVIQSREYSDRELYMLSKYACENEILLSAQKLKSENIKLLINDMKNIRELIDEIRNNNDTFYNKENLEKENKIINIAKDNLNKYDSLSDKLGTSRFKWFYEFVI